MVRKQEVALQVIIGCAVALGGAVILWLGLRGTWRAVILATTAERVPGRVIRHLPMADDAEHLRLEVAFDYGGRQHLHTTDYGSTHPRAIGRATTVLVPRRSPEQARVATLGGLWMMPVMLLGLGAAFVAAGLVLVAGARAPA